MKDIVLENKMFCLTLGSDCRAKSLVLKISGEQCIYKDSDVPFFSLTESRPFNNEIKLSHPNKRTVFNANSLDFDGKKLVVGFDTVTFKAVVDVKISDCYIAFTLEDFVISPTDFEGLDMDVPPVTEFRLVQLPVIERENFGNWLNVSFDDNAAIAVLATSPHARIDSEKCGSCRIMTADAVKGIRLKGCTAVLVVSEKDELLDCIEQLETDYDMPKGVKSRRSDDINASAYWIRDVSPSNVDKHIELALKSGFRMMLMSYFSFFDMGYHGFNYCGNYEIRKEYGGHEGVTAMLEKIKSAGIKPGLHFLHTHIGLNSKYVTPTADHRLNLKRYFTLSKDLGVKDDVIYVEQNPEGTVMNEKCRVLKFGSELIYYEGYTTEYPYSFYGCKRGYYDTVVTAHHVGEIGGILDISEYGATSCYLDQNSSLQDEIGDRIANLYNCGFEFAYFDGSEGTNEPFEYHIPNAQLRVYKKLKPEPIFSECAAKSHFSWHMMSGGNAFDVFPTDVFKKKIAEHPLEESFRMAKDFTRVNFGWWAYRMDTMPDIYEYGTSKAASVDCTVTMRSDLEIMRKNPRTSDNLEVMRRWEDVRAKKWLTDEQKNMLKNPKDEYTLLIDGNGEYILAKYTEIECVSDISAFIIDTECSCAVIWHKTGECKLRLPVCADKLEYLDEFEGNSLKIHACENSSVINVGNKSYIKTKLSRNELVKILENAEIC